MRRKFKQLWSPLQPISTNGTITSPFNSLNIKKTTRNNVTNPGSGFRQTQQYGGVKPVNGIPTLLLITGSSMATHIDITDMKPVHICFSIKSTTEGH